MSKNLPEGETGAIIKLPKDIIDSFPIDLKQRLGEELTSKLAKNLLETLSPKTLQSAQSSQVAGSQQVSGGSPSTEFRATNTAKVDERAPGRG